MKDLCSSEFAISEPCCWISYPVKLPIRIKNSSTRIQNLKNRESIEFMRLTILILIFLCFSCETRTSSDKRFETNIGFALPTEKEVLRDEYHDMLQDYAIIYEVELSTTSNQMMISKIRSLIETNSKECNWSFADNGFNCLCEKGLTLYIVTYDTLNRRLKYEELAD